MRLLLFGGSFDPPHIGHMALLQNAIVATAPCKVLVMPAGCPPHKQAAVTSGAVRLAMCQCFLPLFENMEISDMELRRQGKSYTLDTVRELKAQTPGAEVYLSIGGDMLCSFTAWHRYRELLAEAVLVVQTRGEEDLALQKAAGRLSAEGGRIIWATGDTPLVSSSFIRQGLAAGRDMFGLIPPPADAIVKKQGLYRT